MINVDELSTNVLVYVDETLWGMAIYDDNNNT